MITRLSTGIAPRMIYLWLGDACAIYRHLRHCCSLLYSHVYSITAYDACMLQIRWQGAWTHAWDLLHAVSRIVPNQGSG